ncbi:MAG: YciI family protein [Actinomycetota bacterium]
MNQYLLSTYGGGDDGPSEPPSPEQMQQMMQGIIALEAEMEEAGAFTFGGGLHGADAATVVRQGDAGVVMTDGPYVESKEHIAGFYIVAAEDLDEALRWADKVSATVGRPIEVRPFMATGKVADHMPG